MFGGQTLLGGERNTKKIEGFALGNSPLEYTPEIVSGKTIILYTTNGSKAVVKAKFSENLYVCSLLEPWVLLLRSLLKPVKILKYYVPVNQIHFHWKILYVQEGLIQRCMINKK